MTHRDAITAASARYEKLQGKADEAKAAFFDLCAKQVQAHLDTPETVANRSFTTAVTIRKELRERGVAPLSRGRKPRAEDAQK